MQNRLFIAILVGFIAVMGFVGCGGGSSRSVAEEVSASVEVDSNMMRVRLPLAQDTTEMLARVPARSYDTVSMGRIAQGEVLEGKFRIVNVSDKPLVIIQVITGCGCTTMDYDPAPIPPNSEMDVTWRFNSKGRLGQQFSAIEIITSSRQCATVYLSGDVYMQAQ